jgi:uncharacterized membrane protein YcjF (UPF0283 family)
VVVEEATNKATLYQPVAVVGAVLVLFTVLIKAQTEQLIQAVVAEQDLLLLMQKMVDQVLSFFVIQTLLPFPTQEAD